LLRGSIIHEIHSRSKNRYAEVNPSPAASVHVGMLGEGGGCWACCVSYNRLESVKDGLPTSVLCGVWHIMRLYVRILSPIKIGGESLEKLWKTLGLFDCSYTLPTTKDHVVLPEKKGKRTLMNYRSTPIKITSSSSLKKTVRAPSREQMNTREQITVWESCDITTATTLKDITHPKPQRTGLVPMSGRPKKAAKKKNKWLR